MRELVTLLVEDNPNNVELTCVALEDAHVTNQLGIYWMVLNEPPLLL